MSNATTATTTTISALPLPSTTFDDLPPATIHHASPVVAFLIGLSIILLSSILNAGGLNITKLDHLRTSSLPKSQRRPDFLRPLWVIGMLLYILSQLIGSTLALEYMRAEYVAPLGSTSLIFNFLFASLIGNPVSKWDIYGTIVVVLGVVGIVGFGSINSGLHEDVDVDRLNAIWTRPGWLGYFVLWSLSIGIVYIGTAQLDAILVARADLQALPTSRQANRPPIGGLPWWRAVRHRWANAMLWTREKLDNWTSAKDDKYVAWMLGIGWSCVGGALAGACLVFAKATVKLASLSFSGEATKSQFASPASIITLVLLALTAVSQIICLNRGLKVYDSTLVVPMFYGVYTASGFLNSLVFNDEVNAYKDWTLFCLGLSILVLIAGVVLLTHKKPEPKAAPNPAPGASAEDDMHSLHSVTTKVTTTKRAPRKRGSTLEVGDDSTVYAIGGDSELDSDVEGGRSPNRQRKNTSSPMRSPVLSIRESLRRASVASSVGPPVQKYAGEEGKGLTHEHDDDDEESPASPTPRRADFGEAAAKAQRVVLNDDDDEFGRWQSGRRQ